jgi:exodeoxyribonuclease-5
LWDDAPASKAKLIVIDECSMVDAELGRDLMSFDCPLLVLGDPRNAADQGGGFFTDCGPTMLRGASTGAGRSDRADVDGYPRGRELEIGRHGNEMVARRLDPNRVMSADRWSAATTPAAPTTACRAKQNIEDPCRSRATSWSACATTARRACSMAGCGR